MNAITPFNFDGRAVRVVDVEGAPWFVASDVCAALGVNNHRDAVGRLDPDERGSVQLDTLGGAQRHAAVNEGGLYTLALRCRDAMTPGAAAYRFRKWVTADVLPAIRKTGAYGRAAVAALDDPAALRTLLLGYSERVIAAETRAAQLVDENATLSPKAAALDRIIASDGDMSITAAAKVLQVPPRQLHAWMLANGWLYRRPGDGRALAFQAKISAGYLVQRLATVERPGSASQSFWQVHVTAAGIAALAKRLAVAGRA